MTIGYTSVDYGLARNVLKPETFHKRKIWAWNALICVVLRKVNRILKSSRIAGFISPDLAFRYFGGVSVRKVDLLHFWNGISWGRNPWVVTYESLLPRSRAAHAVLDGTLEVIDLAGLKQLAAPNCRAIIALSQNAYERELKFLEKFPKYRNQIASKLTVLHPPQEILCEDLSRFEKIDVIRFIFVGASFWRKGGEESFHVLRKLRREGLPVELTIVSSLQFQDYAVRPLCDNDRTNLLEQFKVESEWLHYYARVPNEQVLKMMQASHVLLLPTHADTYGYSVLEGQACGCPCITTNVRALPEINNDECGWVIPVPKNPWGEGIYNTEAALADLQHTIELSLESIVRDLCDHPSRIGVRARSSIARIRSRHNVSAHAKKLKRIYCHGSLGNT